MLEEKANIIARVADALGDSHAAARRIIEEEYPHIRPSDLAAQEAEFPTVKPVEIFLRDGFVDYYTAKQLVFPGTLRVLSERLKETFPYHTNWHMEHCHFAYYELFPVLDHKVPLARGGSPRNPKNLVTTSTVVNAAKAGFTVEELRWVLPTPDQLKAKWWDGKMEWFFEQYDRDASLKEDTNIKRWHAAALAFRNRPPGPFA